MKIKINKDVIEKLNPCSDRFDNYSQHYHSFDADILKFLDLENISHSDKLWVSLRVMPKHLVEVFTINMSFSASQYATYAANTEDAADLAATYVANSEDTADAAANAAANAASYAAHAAADAARKIEQDSQISILKYLINSHKGQL